MPNSPVVFEADNAEQRNRLTTFFRLLLVIPHMIVLAIYGLGVFFAVVIAWFALLSTGRWPEALYTFVAGYARWNARVNGYLFLLADPYPPFSTGEHPEYPTRLHVGPPKDSYNRMKVLFRIFLAIPVIIVLYVIGIVAELVGFVAWVTILILGRLPEGLHSTLRFTTSYSVRSTVYLCLLTEDWPSFSDTRLEAGPFAG